MPIELEAKVKVTSHEASRRCLQAHGAALVGDFFECNQFFDTPDHHLRKQGSGLRLRQMTSTDGSAKAKITFKGPRQTGPFKRREEVELAVGDFVAAKSLLAALEFVPLSTFQKKRESWQLGPCQVELDELPYLGYFVEIEGPDEATITHTLQQLQLENLPHIKEAYITLLLEHCRHYKLDPANISF